MLSVRVVAALARALPRQAGLVSVGTGRAGLDAAEDAAAAAILGSGLAVTLTRLRRPPLLLGASQGLPLLAFSAGSDRFSASRLHRPEPLGRPGGDPGKVIPLPGSSLQPPPGERERLKPLDGSEKRAWRSLKARWLFWDGVGRAEALETRRVRGRSSWVGEGAGRLLISGRG